MTVGVLHYVNKGFKPLYFIPEKLENGIEVIWSDEISFKMWNKFQWNHDDIVDNKKSYIKTYANNLLLEEK
jgi:hypothetical protein